MNAPTPNRSLARLPRGFVDRSGADLAKVRALVDRVRRVYELSGFTEIETPAVEYTEALGKFLPDLDRPNAGVFSFQDDDGQWLSLRYDLTAPLARYVAEHFETLPKPFRSWRFGQVFRNEKPGPGRYRQFLQLDADTVGSDNPASDAEMAMLMADALEAAGLPRGEFVVKVNSRKVLDGVMEAAGLAGPEKEGQRLTVLRAIDKLDRLGLPGVTQLLGEGRLDESGDFTKGAGLSPQQSAVILRFVGAPIDDEEGTISALASAVGASERGRDGVDELARIAELLEAAGYQDRVRIDPSVVRGLEYYTGPVFEAEFTREIRGEDGQLVRFGSVAGGGRYDGLVARFRGEPAPATGFSIGVSRLLAALAMVEGAADAVTDGPVVVLVLDREHIDKSMALAAQLRAAKIPAEIYLGSAGMRQQMRYADRRRSPCVVIQGSDERAAGTVTVKDLIEGQKASQSIADRAAWTEERPGQETVPQDQLVAKVSEYLARHGLGPR